MVVLHPLIFDTASHCVFIIRVVECGLDKRTIRWVANGLCHQAEGGVTSTEKLSCSQELDTSLRPALGPVPLLVSPVGLPGATGGILCSHQTGRAIHWRAGCCSEGPGEAGNWAEIWDLQVRGLSPSCKFACDPQRSCPSV